jgi:hypothetical protein
MTLAIKTFEVEHGSTPEMRYQILIRFRSVIFENILMDTQRAAFDEMERRGYHIVGKSQ